MKARNQNSVSTSAWAPFSSPAFSLLWTATLVSNTGTWMHDVGAGWLMTTLNSSPTIVSLVQAATTLPIFLFALLAGAIADRVDKKRMLLVINMALFLIVSLLALLVYLQWMTPSLLLLFTLLVGTGSAFMAPAWQAVVPSLVPKEQLKSAVALGSLSINISRAIGPALAGIMITVSGLAAPFIANALSFLVIIIALMMWRQSAVKLRALPPESILPAMWVGLRHVRYNGPMRDTLTRAAGFFFFASVYWALLPLIARSVPNGDAGLYGILLAAIGAGAVAGALLLPTIRQNYSADWLVAWGSLGTALAMVVFASAESTLGLVLVSFLAGLSWITVLTSLNVSAQMALPDWVRARGLAVYLMVFFGSLASGSAFWGQVAGLTSNSMALFSAAILLVLAIPITWKAKLGWGEQFDLSPSNYWPNPEISTEVRDPISHEINRGPAVVTITYQINAKDEHDFLEAIYRNSEERYRNGAFAWGIYQNIEQPNEWVEWFQLRDWYEHLRQHQRHTHHDREVQEDVKRFLMPEEKPLVRHLVAPKSRDI